MVNEDYMFDLLKTFEKTIIFKSPEDQKIGLLKYDEAPENTAFVFKFDECEENRTFHSVGMKFNFDIYFYNKYFKLVCKYENVSPGKRIICKGMTKYVVEIPV